MHTATAPTTTAAHVASRPRKRMYEDIGARLAGLGALGFAAIVVLQNMLRGSTAPANGASGEEVLAYYADHRTTTFVLVATFVLSGAGLATFLGGAMRRLLGGTRPGWAITGCIGAAGVMALFAVVVAAEQGLSVVATGDRPDLGTIEALWVLHNSVFTVLYLSLAIALLGLSRAGVAAGLTPRAFELLAGRGRAPRPCRDRRTCDRRRRCHARLRPRRPGLRHLARVPGVDGAASRPERGVMSTPGYPRTIENGAGERLTFVRRVGDRLEVENVVAPGSGPPMHVHHHQEEALTIEQGRIGYERPGEPPQFAERGATVVFKPGEAHRFWNAGQEELRCTGYIEPADNLEYFLTAIYASQRENGGSRPGPYEAAFLARRFGSEFGMSQVPGPVQRLVFPVLAAVGRLLGTYGKYADAPDPVRR